MAEKKGTGKSKTGTVAKTKKTPVKKTSSGKGAKTSPPVSSPPETGGSRGPLYVLIIMGLLAVIAFTVNSLIEKRSTPLISSADKKIHDKIKKTPPDRSPGKSGSPSDKTPEKERSTDASEKTSSHPVKEEKENKISMKEVRLFFLVYNEKSDRVEVTPVTRRVPDDKLIETTLNHLLSGPGKNEKARGYLTALPSSLRIRDVIRSGSYLTIDFNSAIEEGAGAGIILNRLDQIIYTATQFEGIKGVYIKINGRSRSVIGSDGVAISGPLRRK